jgi:ketosteroid isomerase-like protein
VLLFGAAAARLGQPLIFQVAQSLSGKVSVIRRKLDPALLFCSAVQPATAGFAATARRFNGGHTAQRPNKPAIERIIMSTQGSTPNQADLLAIDRVREAHVAALNPGSVDAFVAVFSEDAVQMPPNAPANAGRAMIRAWVQAFLDPLHVQFALEVEEVQVAGDWAFERGTYRIRVTPKAGGEGFPDAGKYITIYRKQPNNPPPGMG